MSSSWALIQKEGEILMIRRALDRGRGGQWCMPGGTMWKGELPEVACVRETYEETGLRVTIKQPIAVFRDSHYFLCSLNAPDPEVRLRTIEASDYIWTQPKDILRLGTIMDLRRVIPLFSHVGLTLPDLPHGLKMAVPEALYGS
jgi:8-oxo-dGTP diphosphatase